MEAAMILSLRFVPGFWIAVEEQARPALRSQPLIMGGLPHQRGTVQQANIPARQAGVQTGMTLSQAYQQCSHGVFLLPDLPRYEGIWDQICEVLRGYSPVVEPVEMGQAVCDLAGCERYWTSPRETARELLLAIQQCTGILPYIGIGANRLVAELASLDPSIDGISVIEGGQERAFLANIPLALLPNFGPTRLALTFQVLGLHTASQLAALPATAVEQRFGAIGKRLHNYARGIDGRPVVAPPVKLSISARYQCEDGSLEDARAGLHRLVATCAEELQSRHLAGRLLELRLLWESSSLHGEGGTQASKARGLPAPAGSFMDAPHTAFQQYHGASGFQETAQVALPIPYRIHSMLPQPNPSPPDPLPLKGGGGVLDGVVSGEIIRDKTCSRGSPTVIISPSPLEGEGAGGRGEVSGIKFMPRTPLTTASQLFEHAQRLLLQRWPRSTDPVPLYALELRIVEFETPQQLAFPDLLWLDQTGVSGSRLTPPTVGRPLGTSTGQLGGINPARRQAIDQQERAFTARFGCVPFQHVTQVDPGSILTERRFRWQSGLSWNKTAGRDGADRRCRKRDPTVGGASRDPLTSSSMPARTSKASARRKV
jgi:DNA polymerase IV